MIMPVTVPSKPIIGVHTPILLEVEPRRAEGEIDRFKLGLFARGGDHFFELRYRRFEIAGLKGIGGFFVKRFRIVRLRLGVRSVLAMTGAQANRQPNANGQEGPADP